MAALKPEILPHVPRNAPLPFSLNQYLIIDVSQKYPRIPPHYWHLPLSLEIAGKLDIPVLQQCLNELGQRHESVRTGFVTVNGQLQVLVRDTVFIDLPIVEVEHASQMAPLLQNFIQQPFELSAPPLVRVMLFRLSADHHILVSVYHHLVADAWSQNIFLRELARLYTGFKAGQAPSLRPLKWQYVNYAAWEYRQLQTESMVRKMDYWRQKLSAMPSLLKLTTDRPRPLMMNFEGRIETFRLLPPLSEQLAVFARRQQVSIFTVLLAAFFTLLCKYSHQTDIVVGVPVANRSYLTLYHIVGCFAKILPFRQQLSDSLSVQRLLQQVQQTTSEALDNQDAPVQSLVKTLNLRSHPGHQLLYQVIFAFQNAVLHRLEFPGLSLTFDASVWRSLGIARNDIVWQIFESADGLTGLVEYRADLFDVTTIKTMIDTYTNLLEYFIIDPDRLVSELL